ncbi:rod shape-determining protein [Aneurinibacillus terranovensis]|uniref:rod shape-determining protein n=1 Tax=Aneurinibacillus terranovensis TaxID=278991 RepID=UPI000415D3DD|nr:rod shape-determining protein [Aneurinibacillus terranovensis]
MFENYDVTIDLGTSNTLIYVKRKHIVVREPTMVAKNLNTGVIEAFGIKAKNMIGRTPEDIVVIRPMNEGVVVDCETTTAMLQHFMELASKQTRLVTGMKWRKPNVLVCVPTGITSVEKRAIYLAVKQAGAQDVQTIEEPLAAAIGAGLPVQEPAGCMVVDIGGGTTQAAVLSYGGIAVSSSIRTAGDVMDQAIIQYIKKHFNARIGEGTAEEIKIDTGYAFLAPPDEKREVTCVDLVTGLPKTIKVFSEEISKVLSNSVNCIIDAVKSTLEVTPPELASDMIDRGIVLTGGGALLRNIDTLLRNETGLPVHVAETPLDCVVAGMGRLLDIDR